MKSLLSKLYCIGFYVKEKYICPTLFIVCEPILLSNFYHPSFLKICSFIDKLHLFISFLLT